MVSDVGTVIWKEWKELIARSSRSRGETVKTIAILAVILGITLWRASFFLNNLGSLLVPSFVLVQLLGGLMADSFAGERERHTHSRLYLQADSRIWRYSSARLWREFFSFGV